MSKPDVTDLFGRTCRDKITGFTGVCVGINEWMFGCQYVLLQPIGKKKRSEDARTVSIGKLEVLDEIPDLDMEIPKYEPPKYFGKICRDKVTGYEGMCIGRVSVFYSSDQYYLKARVRKGRPILSIAVDEGRIEVIEDSEFAIEPEEVQTQKPGGVHIDIARFV